MFSLLDLQPEFQEGERREKKVKNGRDKSNDVKPVKAVVADKSLKGQLELVARATKAEEALEILQRKYGTQTRYVNHIELKNESLERQLELALEQEPSLWQRFIGKVWR